MRFRAGRAERDNRHVSLTVSETRALPPSALRELPIADNFIGAANERDPMVGRQDDGATFTIPKEPVRRRVHGIETFNVLRGGEYFFMPSLSALRWLGNLEEQGSIEQKER